jgi:5-formyltetrahydrofolate cyclo-ligase
MEDDFTAKRNELRMQMKSRREKLSQQEADKNSNLIIHRLMELQPIRKGHNIMCYSSFKNEADLKLLIDSHSMAGTILLPRTKENGDMEAVEFTGWEHTYRSKYGILEPEGEAYPVNEIDAVIVPGLVFDFKATD